jgi:hypothetical protein
MVRITEAHPRNQRTPKAHPGATGVRFRVKCAFTSMRFRGNATMSGTDPPAAVDLFREKAAKRKGSAIVAEPFQRCPAIPRS